ncbi:AraC family transcriptional regulator [Alcanivorax sp. JB21]|uniref:AraC family transcriptional regulator n=1 Tax=Alcanivorax limicola TaxID=2874102 RepID=UPI001CC13FB1|nr:AraC family transcriptional regulator [Alcanivorax limicola]MBZ2189817.1 AraC family transcriptional regulator [Alcanivorax limicola]
MPHTSNWPLPDSGDRVLLPHDLTRALAKHDLSCGCYPQAFGYYPEARGHRMARARPEDHLVIYCVAGAGWLTLENDAGESVRQSVAAGDLLLLPAGRAHTYGADNRQPWSLYWVHLGGIHVPALFARVTDIVTVQDSAETGSHARISARVTPGDAASRIAGGYRVGLHERLVNDFQALLAIARGGYRLTAFLHAADLCRGLLSYAALLMERPPAHQHTLDLAAVHHLMATQLDQRPSLADLASAAGQASTYQFIRRYRALTGQTPMQAFLHRKIERACYLLEVSDLTVAEIARQLGYDDPYYFSRLFRKIARTSPARYRQGGAPPI